MTLPSLPPLGSPDWYPWAQGVHAAAAKVNNLGVVNAADYGASPTATAAANTSALTQAITAAAGGTVLLPAGEYPVTPIAITSNVTLTGVGPAHTALRNTTGSVLTIGGSRINVRDLTLRSDGGGAAVRQTAAVDQGTWENFRIIQTAAGQCLWDNAGFDYVDMRMIQFYSEHVQAATVPGWKLSSSGGTISDNVWQRGRAQYSGNYHFLVESTGANAQYSNSWRDVTFEVCTGGGIRLVSVRDYEISNCVNWDMQAGTPSTGQRHFISAERNASGITCNGVLRRLQRLAGTNAAGVYDVSLPGFGAGSGTIIEFCRNVATNDPFTINDQGNAIYFVDSESAGRTQLLDGTGSVTIDFLGLSIGGKKIRQGTAAPTTGTWAVGDKVWNTAPAAGGFEGWICTTAGTPGTWKTFGAISA